MASLHFKERKKKSQIIFFFFLDIPLLFASNMIIISKKFV